MNEEARAAAGHFRAHRVRMRDLRASSEVTVLLCMTLGSQRGTGC